MPPGGSFPVRKDALLNVLPVRACVAHNSRLLYRLSYSGTTAVIVANPHDRAWLGRPRWMKFRALDRLVR